MMRYWSPSEWVAYVLLVLCAALAVGAIATLAWRALNPPATITLRADEWQCVRHQEHTHLQPVLAGKATVMIPMTSRECAEYVRR